MMALTNSAGNASSARMVAMKMPHTVSGMRIIVMPRAARLQHGHHVVQAAHREADDEDRERNEHQDDAPVRARRAGEDRLRRVQRPAGARSGPPGTKKLAISTSTASR